MKQDAVAYFIILVGLTFLYMFAEKKRQSSTLLMVLFGSIAYGCKYVFEVGLLSCALLGFAVAMACSFGYESIRYTQAGNIFIFRWYRSFSYAVESLFELLLKMILSLVKTVIKPSIQLKPAFGSPKYQALLKVVKKRQWDVAHRTIEGLSPEERELYLDALSDEKLKPQFFESWLQAMPESTWAFTVYGDSCVKWAWDARGSGTADTVSDASAMLFFERLNMSAIAYEHAMSLDDTNPEPYAGMLIVAKGLSFDDESKWELFVQLVKRNPDHSAGHISMLDAINPKWGGTEEEMFQFARRGVDSSDSKPYQVGLVLRAHIEMWLYYGMIGMESEHQHYFYQADVKNEIDSLFRRHYGEFPSPGSFSDWATLNSFAFCYLKMGEFDTAAEILTFLGDKGTAYPWCYDSENWLNSIDNSYAYSDVCESLGVV